MRVCVHPYLHIALIGIGLKVDSYVFTSCRLTERTFASEQLFLCDYWTDFIRVHIFENSWTSVGDRLLFKRKKINYGRVDPVFVRVDKTPIETKANGTLALKDPKNMITSSVVSLRLTYELYSLAANELNRCFNVTSCLTQSIDTVRNRLAQLRSRETFSR